MPLFFVYIAHKQVSEVIDVVTFALAVVVLLYVTLPRPLPSTLRLHIS